MTQGQPAQISLPPGANHALQGTVSHVEVEVIIDPSTGQSLHRVRLLLDNGASLDIVLTPDAMRTLEGDQGGSGNPRIQGGPVPLDN